MSPAVCTQEKAVHDPDFRSLRSPQAKTTGVQTPGIMFVKPPTELSRFKGKKDVRSAVTKVR